MMASQLGRTAILIGGVLIAVVVLACTLMDPWGRKARQRMEHARAVASAEHLRRQHTAQAQIHLMQKRQLQQQITLRRQTDQSVETARAQTDAKTALGQDRHHRLGEHDRFLCQQAPTMDGC